MLLELQEREDNVVCVSTYNYSSNVKGFDQYHSSSLGWKLGLKSNFMSNKKFGFKSYSSIVVTYTMCSKICSLG